MYPFNLPTKPLYSERIVDSFEDPYEAENKINQNDLTQL